MKDKGFKVTWEVEDGYCGGSRPQTFHIDPSEIDADMDEKEMRNLFIDLVQADFEQRASWSTGCEDAFVDWAKQIQKDAE